MPLVVNSAEAVARVKLIGSPALLIAEVVVVGRHPLCMKHGLLGKTVTEAELCGGVQVAIRSLVALAVSGLRSRLLVAVFTCGVAVLLCVRVAYAGPCCDGTFWRVVSQVAVDGPIKQFRC